jgi:cadherin EGF LAG seven-pass G-type receptor 1
VVVVVTFAEASQEREQQRRDFESDSDASQREGRSRALEMPSSHSSEEEEEAHGPKASASAKPRKSTGVTTQEQSALAHPYLPNISTNGPEPLNVLHCSSTDLFPNIKPIYAPRWSSQLPEAYLPSTNGEPHTSKLSPTNAY